MREDERREKMREDRRRSDLEEDMEASVDRTKRGTTSLHNLYFVVCSSLLDRCW